MKISRLTPVAIVRRRAQAFGLLPALVAILTLALVGNSIAYAQGPANTNATKQKLQGLGLSKHIKVKEQDGSTVKGTLTAVNDDSFQLIPKDGGAPVAISYSQVVKVNHDGMPTAAKVAIWVVVGIGVVALVATIIFFHDFH